MITLTMHQEIVDGEYVSPGISASAFVALNDLIDDNCILKAPSLMYEVIVPEMFSEIEVEDIDDLADAIEEMFDELDAKDVPAKPYFYVDDREPEPTADEGTSAPVDDDCDPVEWVEDDTERVQDPTPSKYECILINGKDFNEWVPSLPRQDTASNREA